MIKAKLIVVGGDAKRTEVTLKQLPATIGRAREASITLPHSLVSRKHCELFEKNEQLFVKDLNSLNGTYLNSEKIVEAMPIQPGQLLTLGNVTFRAEIDAAENNTPFNEQTPIPKEIPANDGFEINCENAPVVGFSNDDTEHAIPSDEANRKKDQIVLNGEMIPPAAVSFGAIKDLPQVDPAASFTGQIDSTDNTVQVDPETIQIHLDDKTGNEIQPTESSLKEFFRKMPK